MPSWSSSPLSLHRRQARHLFPSKLHPELTRLGFQDISQERQQSPRDDRRRRIGTSFDQAHLAANPTLQRECDDEAIKRGRVYVDNAEALVEAGELVGALERGLLGKMKFVVSWWS
ncbi:hypothetical protein F3Y22_tig00000002pilonHSYRG00233 [Hibiscus syriacus]|uniref:Uncharacterized protein n=1 Tax=Hibiscus syriacus TaxID=106335 RepID=A0A6A3D3Q4_HIBSY|nr:hypothetical protein F3Y22_tig00000002pilonHSYRG00233 [Hibiscus syriacus]